MVDSLHFYAPIEKTDDEQQMVYGYASTEALDSQGEIVKKDALSTALDDYMKFANIREMHQPSAVGKTKKAQIDKKGLYIAAKVVDPLAWKKVKEGVYSGFSIGGRVEKQVDNEITGLKLSEISLVDRPANPEAVIDVWKADGMETEKRNFSTDERKSLADSGKALPDGSFPIVNVEDLKNAVKAIGRAKNKVKAKAHIIARAKALGATSELPDDWKTKKMVEQEMEKAAHMGAAVASMASQMKMMIDQHKSQGHDTGHLEDAFEALKLAAGKELEKPEDYDGNADGPDHAVYMAEKTEDLAKEDVTEVEEVKEEVKEDAAEEEKTEEKPTEETKTEETPVIPEEKKEDVDETPTEEVKEAPAEETKEEVKEVSEKTEMEKIEDALKSGKMPTEEQIVYMLKSQDIDVNEANISVLKYSLAGKLLEYIEKSHKEQMDKDFAKQEAEKVQKETPVVVAEKKHQFDEVIVLVNELEKMLSKETVEKADQTNVHTWEEVTVPQLAEDPKAAVSQLLEYFQNVVRVIASTNQGSQMTPKQQDTEANGVNEGSDRSAGGHFDEDQVKPNTTGAGDGDEDADDGIIQPGVVRRPMKADQTEDLTKFESEITLLKAEIEKLKAEPMPVKIAASYVTVEKSEKTIDAKMELEKATKRADELHELMKSEPTNVAYQKEADELAPQIMRLQREIRSL